MTPIDGPRRGMVRLMALGAVGLAAAGTVPIRAAAAQDAALPSAPVEWPTVRLLDGTVWTPASWQGLAGVLVIWATWCPFCKNHNPHVEKLFRAVANRPMRVLGATLDRDPEVVRRYARERGYTFPMSMDGETLRDRFGLRRVTPTTVTFDRRGRLLQRIPGEMFEEDMLALARLADGPA